MKFSKEFKFILVMIIILLAMFTGSFLFNVLFIGMIVGLPFILAEYSLGVSSFFDSQSSLVIWSSLIVYWLIVAFVITLLIFKLKPIIKRRKTIS